MRRVYIVLSTAGVGGAEKRFTDNWHELLSQGMDIHLVMDNRTYAGLCEQPGYAEKLVARKELHVRDLGGNNYRRYCVAVWRFFATQPRNCVVHYPLAYVPGVQMRYGHRLLMSWVNSAMPPFKRRQWRNGLGAWAGFFAADYIDVLNPNNLESLRKVPGMRRKAGLTAGGTQIDSALYRPFEKGLDFVFLGRLEPEKQALRFVQMAPEVNRLLRDAGYQGYRFVICGDGRETEAIRALISGGSLFSEVPIYFGYSSNPEQVLGRAAVYFSLQRTSNYPSKALAEAMSCGAFPILTEVGESALMVDGLQHYEYVPRDFVADDLARALVTYLSADADDRSAWVGDISGYAAFRFARGKQADYFAEKYRQLG